MKFEIKQRFTGAVLFSLECDSFKLCIEAAVKERANLAGADLAGANLAYANLAGAYLAEAYLAGANLADAYLAGANLAGANLAGANLAGANLAGAYLAGANLAGANLAGANLADAYLADANLAAHLGYPNGWNAWTYFDTKLNEQRVQVGCQNKTIAEGRAYWSDKPNRREVMAALDYAEAIGKLRGWGV